MRNVVCLVKLHFPITKTLVKFTLLIGACRVEILRRCSPHLVIHLLIILSRKIVFSFGFSNWILRYVLKDGGLEVNRKFGYQFYLL